MMGNLFNYLLLSVVILIICKETNSIGDRFDAPGRRLETYSSRYEMPSNDPNIPFSFGYRFTDDHGTLQTREEKTDPDGSKTGSYSFVDAAGTYRQVDYIADDYGFRATVKTNEPGTVTADPAHVSIRADNNINNVHSPLQRNVRNLPQLLFSNQGYPNHTNSNARNNFVHQPQRDPYFNDEANYGNRLSFNAFPNHPRPPPTPHFGDSGNQPVQQNTPTDYYRGSHPQMDFNSPEGYPKHPGFSPEEFFNDPSFNSRIVFEDKIADSGLDNKPSYSLLPPARFPRRQRRPRPRQARQNKIHIPKGYESHQDILPLYMDR